MAKLLLVEDDVQVRAMLGETLRQEAHQVLEARNGDEALSLFEAERPDLVITDIIMPGKDGVETIHALRRRHAAARIIAISGGSANIGGEHLLRTAESLGADRSFAKPVDVGSLLEAVDELLRDR